MMRRLLPRALLTAIIAAMLACTSSSAPDGPLLTISLSMERAASPAPSLAATLDGRHYLVSVRDAGTSAPETRAPRFGVVPVAAALVTSAGDTLAATSFVQDFAPRHAHWIAAYVGTRRPMGFCTGAIAAAPLRSGSDTLFVMHGRLPEGAVC